MPRINNVPLSSRWIETVAIGGLLAVIAIAGLIGLTINDRSRNVTDHVLLQDIRLEDRADDLRVGVLDMRHYHRNLIFAGPSRRGLADFESAYGQLLENIAALEALEMDDPAIAEVATLRASAEAYYGAFRPAIDVYATDRAGFTAASDAGLITLTRLEGAARELDTLGDARVNASLRSLETAAQSERVVLLVVLGTLMLVGAGLVSLMAGILREQKRTSAELAGALDLKNNFIADASHELRTPLTVLRANAEVALMLDTDCAHGDLLREIVHESDRMARLVEDLLFLARSDFRMMPLDLEPVPFAPFFAHIAERAATLAAESGGAVTLRESAEGVAWLDRHRIEQVLLILVDNALRYGASAEPVTLGATFEGDELVVEVTDRGVGIPPEELPLIFERFHRVDKARSRREGGVGLGLAIAKSIVEAHGGRIEAQSALGEGTTIRFALPLRVPEVEETEGQKEKG